MGAGDTRAEMMEKLRMLLDGIPLKDLHLSADPMSEGETMRALDRESAKAAIESDTDQGMTLIDTLAGPAEIIHPYEQGAWIFPDGHPLAAYERLAAIRKDTQALDSMKELMPGDSPLPNDE
jgi:hypothetical protein